MPKELQPRPEHYLGVGQNIQVVGTEYRSGVIGSIENLRFKDVSLVPEPNNPYDANAISVRYEGKKIGYISRYWAKRYSPKITQIFRAGYLPVARISQADGFNIKISIAKPHELLLYPQVTRPTRRYAIPKTFEVDGNFPILVRVPKPKKEKPEKPKQKRSLFRFPWGKKKSE